MRCGKKEEKIHNPAKLTSARQLSKGIPARADLSSFIIIGFAMRPGNPEEDQFVLKEYNSIASPSRGPEVEAHKLHNAPRTSWSSYLTIRKRMQQIQQHKDEAAPAAGDMDADLIANGQRDTYTASNDVPGPRGCSGFYCSYQPRSWFCLKEYLKRQKEIYWFTLSFTCV